MPRRHRTVLVTVPHPAVGHGRSSCTGKEERGMGKYGINDSKYDPYLDGPKEDKNSGKSRDDDCADHSNCPYISRWSCPYLNSSVCNYAVYW